MPSPIDLRGMLDRMQDASADFGSPVLFSDAEALVVMIDWLRALEPHLDAVICYASDMGEHPPNRVVAEIRAALGNTTLPAASEASNVGRPVPPHGSGP